jgi:4'-phosphopantetheinyl transferase
MVDVVPTLPPRTVHVWQDRLDEGDSRPWMSHELSAEDAIRAVRFQVPERRRAFIRGRLMARHLLAHYLGRSVGSIALDVHESGKPFVRREEGDPAVEIGVAHSNGVLLVAISSAGPIGVDTERVDPAIQHDLIARRFFAPEETAALAACAPAEHDRAFFRCWTRKEAFVKALGDGLGYSLSSFVVSVDDAAISPVSPATGWHVHDVAPGAGYEGALAAHDADTVVRRLRFAP